MWVDEAAFIEYGMFVEVIVPLIGMRKARLFMITTPADQFNYFSKLVKKIDPTTGFPIFVFVHLKLACDRCINKKQSILCVHRLKYLPPWKSEASSAIITEILKDEQATLERENLGMIAEAGESMIPKEIVEKWTNSPRFDPNQQKLRSKMVILCIDPNGGTTAGSSDMAIVSIALLYGMRIVSFFNFFYFFGHELGRCLRCKGGVTTPTVVRYIVRIARTKDVMSRTSGSEWR